MINMKIVVKIISGLLIAAILLIVGYFGYRFVKNGFDFNKTFGIGVSENLIEEKEITTLKEINIDFNTSNVEIKHSEDTKFKVMLYSDRVDTHTLIEEAGILKVSINEKKLKFMDRLFNHKISRILIYVPKDYEGKIIINGDVGDINIDDYQFTILNTKLNVGDIYVDGIKEANIDLDVGSLKVKKAYSNFVLKVDTGDIRMKEATVLKDSNIDVGVGNVKIEETNDIKVNTEVEVGKADVAKNNSGALIKLDIKVKVGNITVLAPKEEETKTND